MSVLVNLLPYYLGQIKHGTKFSPYLITNILQKKHKNLKINNLPNINNYDNIHSLQKYIMKNIRTNASKVINIGGDHAVSIGTVPPMIKKFPKLKVLWVDAHADINNKLNSSSNNTHGMPVYYLSELYRYDYQLNFENLMYVGLRDIDDFEKHLINKHMIKNMSPDNLCRVKLCDFVGDDPIHVSFDFDVIDPTQFYCTGTHAFNGIRMNKLEKLLSSLPKNNIVSVDLVEFNPLIGSKDHYNKSMECIENVCELLI
tara:strand:- start:265 stop:1035 length:771 start_codon:yes stop_codon:yes gene_type:complete